MNPDWTFPTQNDQLGANATQVSTGANFLADQDGINTTLWEGLSAPPTSPLSDPTGVTGFGEDSAPDLSWCVCSFPGTYCSQHHTYGALQESELFLPSFNSGEGMAYSYDFLAQSEQSPEFLRLPELSPTFPPIEEIDSDIFACGRSSPSHTHQEPPRSSEAPKKRLSRRSRISATAKHVLETYFSSNPYPDKEGVAQLNKETGLNAKSIKTWFCNFRHRKARGRTIDPVLPIRTEAVGGSQSTRADSYVVPPKFTLAQAMAEPRLPMTASAASMASMVSLWSMALSSAGLEELNQVSPAHSTNSIERYLATPLEQEAVDSSALDSLSVINSETPVEERYHRSTSAFNSIDSLRERSERHKTGSVGSVASRNSFESWTSQNSINSRGSRRGRRNWARPSGGINKAPLPNTKSNRFPTTGPSKHTWYCTSLDCDKSFWYRYDWDRHEMAVHYWPYQWVCDVGMDASTVHKDAASRIFFRQDQFLAHLMSAHPGADITKNAISASMKENPDFNRAALSCGFCYHYSRNWEERQDHVAAHLKNGLPKSKWIPFGRSRFGMTKSSAISD